MSAGPLLSVRDLVVGFGSAAATRTIVAGVSFDLNAREILALVGESGSGKTLTCRSLIGLLPAGARAGGAAHFEGVNLLDLGEAGYQRVRGRRIGMVFQNPGASLNPYRSIGSQMKELIRARESVGRRLAREQAAEFLKLVALPDPARCLTAYPHQLSVGMQQRVAVALALCGAPALLIADEPTSALDVTIQAQVLRLFDDIRRSAGIAILLVTHDLGVVSALADRVMVMNSGLLFESAPTVALFANPRNPYTRSLLALARSPLEENELGLLRTAADPGQGCPIASRCAEAKPACAQAAPPWQPVADQHWSRCWWT